MLVSGLTDYPLRVVRQAVPAPIQFGNWPRRFATKPIPKFEERLPLAI